VAITEHDRHKLYLALEHLLGTSEATTLMEHLPPVGWADVATRHDLDQGLALVRADLHAELADLRTDMRTEIGELRTEMRTEIGELRTEARTGSAELRTEMADLRAAVETSLRQMIPVVVGATAAIVTAATAVGALV
jgi:hypothetical protein